MENNLFLGRLNNQLRKVPEADRKEMLYDFEEHFQIGLANGNSVEQITEELGDPKLIAKDLLADYHLSKAETDKTLSNILRAIFATISLSVFNLLFILIPVIVLFSVYFSFWILAISFLFSPIVIFVWIFNGGIGVFDFFVALTMGSIGLLLSVGLVYAGKFFYNIILSYIKFNLKIIKGESV